VQLTELFKENAGNTLGAETAHREWSSKRPEGALTSQNPKL
jgi:hypothetical protein